MSLINQMLRDLEQRQGTQSIPPAMASIQTAPHQQSRRHWHWLLPTMLATLYYAWSQYQAKPEATTLVAKIQTPVSSQPAEVAAQPVAQPTIVIPTARPLPTTAPQPTATPTPKPTAIPVSKIESTAPSDKTAASKREFQGRPSNSHNRQAQKLLQQAQNSSSLLMRKETLKEALQLEPDNLEIREQLLSVLTKSGNGNELTEFLTESLQRFPNHPAFIASLAQLQIQRKEFATASGTLERIHSNDPAYLTLQAGSYQQQKRYREAGEIYQRLTTSQPDKAEHWLGMAICADNLAQKTTALQAYQQALEKNTLNAEVVDYINQRLSALR